MTDEFDLVRQFIREHLKADYWIPRDNTFFEMVAAAPMFVREHFEWKGKVSGQQTSGKVFPKKMLLSSDSTAAGLPRKPGIRKWRGLKGFFRSDVKRHGKELRKQLLAESLLSTKGEG